MYVCCTAGLAYTALLCILRELYTKKKYAHKRKDDALNARQYLAFNAYTRINKNTWCSYKGVRFFFFIGWT